MLNASPLSKITLINDPDVLKISIKEKKEPFIDLKNQDIIAFGPSPEIENNTDYTKIRKTVYEKLMQAQKLLPRGIKLCLYEGYRSLELQNRLFEERFRKIKGLYPKWPRDQIFNETVKLVSPVTNKDGSPNIPPHSTGGAVDMYLISDKGKVLDMGILTKDWMKDEQGLLSQTDSNLISDEAIKNRKIMGDILCEVGFINYPTEYWHWSYGDKYWAYQAKEKNAIYGAVETVAEIIK